MTTKTALAGLALAALALSACGGGTPGAPGSATPGSDGSAPSSAGASPTPGGSSLAASPGTTTAQAGDPCDVLDAGAIRDLVGVAVKKGTSQSVSSSTVCTWLPEDGTAADSAVISAQEGALPGPLSQVEDQLKQEFDGSVSTIDVAGAEDARYITGKKSGLDIIDVLAQKDGIFYQVLVAAPRDVSRHKSGAVKVAEALIKA